jgi:DNA replication protein DnaC
VNVLSEEKKQQVIALGRLGWSLRRIQQATGIRRETAARYLKAAGIAVRPPGGWGRAPAKPAIEVTTDFGVESAGPTAPFRQPGRSPASSASEPYRETNRLLERRRKQARFRDPDRTLDNFDFTFNPKMNRSLVFDLATGAFINKREDALFLGPGGTGKSHLAQAIGQAAIQQGYKVLYRETHILLDELAEAIADGTRKEYMESIATVPLLIIDDFGMRKLPHTAAEDLLEIIMRRYERFSTLLTSNRPVEDWGKLLGDVAAVSAMLDRLLHHGHVLKCGPRSWRTKTAPAS